MTLSRRRVFLMLASTVLLFATPVEADSPPSITLSPVTGFSTLGQAIGILVQVVMFAGAMLTFGYLMYGAIKYITARDSADGTAAARKTMQNAAIGLVLLGCVYALFQVVIHIVPGVDTFFSG